MKITKKFFNQNPRIVAQNLLGMTLIRKIHGKELKAKIVETECYLGEKDPASRASKGKTKISSPMWEEEGTILVYFVHKYKMLNFITQKKGQASAVLIRAIEPINFRAKTKGPGLLTQALKIPKEWNNKSFFQIKELKIIPTKEKIKIIKKNRIGVSKDLKEKLRYYIKDNKFISKK
jgi:DNA-3-methyladenine glycosylase